MEPEGKTYPPNDHILDFAIEYKLSGTYPTACTNKREVKSCKKKSSNIDCITKESLCRKKGRVEVVTSIEEQGRIP